MVEAEEDVVVLPKVRRQLDLDLLVEVRALVVVGDSGVHLAGELRAGRLAEDVFEAPVTVLSHELGAKFI